jgi:small ligand-binding sensory domain FIST
VKAGGARAAAVARGTGQVPLIGCAAEAVAGGSREVEVGQTVRFHVRDAGSADEDRRHTLEREAAAPGGRRAAGARPERHRPRPARGMAGQN